MQIVGLVLLILAYTIGIATIIMQLVCYKKEIEYKETIFFSASLLLLIISAIILEFYKLAGKIPGRLPEASFYIMSLLLAVTIPVNIHTERIVKNAGKKNRLIILLAIVLALLFVFSFFVHFVKTAKIIVLMFLNVSILYSMVVISRSRPSILVLHREKIEKITALIFIIILPLYALAAILNHFYVFVDVSILDGSIILSLVSITLALSKLLDDFKRISLFSLQNTCNTDKLTYYNITNRESEVLDLLIKGVTYKEIGDKLFISIPTVKTHVSNIYQKMNIKNKVELVNLINN